MPKVLITTTSFGSFDQGPLEILRDSNLKIVLNPHGRKLTLKEASKLYAHDICGVIAGTELISDFVLHSAKSLKVISRCGSGLDNIDHEVAKQKSISVYATSKSNLSEAVAEFTIGLILSVLRHIPYADRSIRADDWCKPMGALLKGKTLGIIGLGNVGKKVAALAQPFGVRILACDAAKDDFLAKSTKIQYVGFDYLIKNADITTIHVPLTDKTRTLVGRPQLAKMKKSAILINTSRGEIVNEKDLYTALKHRQIAGAALDVFAEEPYRGKLAELDNVVLTSHIAAYAREVRSQMEREAALNLLHGLKRHKVIK